MIASAYTIEEPGACDPVTVMLRSLGINQNIEAMGFESDTNEVLFLGAH